MAAKKVMVGINNEDRISSLPDGILCHILSFLPTKNSARTRVLSTRWTRLFTFVPVLDFKYPSDAYDPDTSRSSASSFVEFVNSVFMLYNVSRMERFHLYYKNLRPLPGISEIPLLSWISSAIYRHVKQIDICFTHGGPWTLPRDLFSSKNLTDLTLYGNFEIVLPSSVCLPCLKTCNLSYVRLNEEKSRRLFQGCPIIEQLRLYCCDMGDDVLNISSHTLKRFSVEVYEDEFRLVLNVPNLVYFEFVDESSSSTDFIGLETLKCLVEAIIHYEQYSDISNSVSIKLVQGISHVQQLSLYCGPMEAFLRSGHSLPTFNNLTRLILGPMSYLSSKLLSDLLDNTPRLEFLSFKQSHRYGYTRHGADQNNYFLPGHVPTCVSLHLKEVECRYFSFSEYESKLIKYFLKNAKNLKKMHIRPNKRWDEQLKIGSAECQIVFDSDGIEEQ